MAEGAIWSPEMRRRPWQRRSTAVHGEASVQRIRERGKGTGWCACSPWRGCRGRRTLGRPDGGAMVLDVGGRGGEESVDSVGGEASQHGSVDEEGEELKAEQVAASVGFRRSATAAIRHRRRTNRSSG